MANSAIHPSVVAILNPRNYVYGLRGEGLVWLIGA